MSFDDLLAGYYDEPKDQPKDELLESLTDSTRYHDFQKISSGGMKDIFKVFDEKTHRYIAYASLKEDLSDVLNEAFINEARLTAKLSHPNIIPIYDVGVDQQQKPYFTMELKTGDSLQDILNQLEQQNKHYLQLYPLNHLLHIYVKICDAVAYAHSQKVIHLDIKPENIQVGQYGEVMLCDWGLSKVYEKQFDTSDLNQILLNPDLLNQASLHGEIKGTPGYMSPEQIDTSKKAGLQSDIFSLGCLLYAILSHKAPFRGTKLEEVLEQTTRGHYETLDEQKVPRSLIAVCQKAMQVKKEDRYQNVLDLKQEIEKFLEGYATHAEKANSWIHLKLFYHRNKLLVQASSFIALIILIAVVLFIKKIQHEKNIAQSNYQKFLDQQEKTDLAQLESIQTKVTQINRIFHTGYNETPLRSLKKTISDLNQLLIKHPNSAEIVSALGYHYFINQDFESAKQHLTHHPGIYEYMLPYIEKYLPLKDKNPHLSVHDFNQLLIELNPYKVLHIKMLKVYSEKIQTPVNLTSCVKILLEKLNPSWSDKLFLYDEGLQKLEIGGDNFYNLGEGDRSPLIALNIKRLILRDTSIKTLKIKNLILNSLDISNTEIPVTFLKTSNLSQLHKLTLAPEQFNQKQLQKLPANLEITYQE